MPQPSLSPAQLHAELDRVQGEFHALVASCTPEDLQRKSHGTKWTNRQLLFHMLFGYLVIRSLRVIVKVMSMAPAPIQHGFAAALDAATRPFHRINYWGSCAGASVIAPARADAWLGRVIESLHRHLDHDSGESLGRTMRFPVTWDPYFAQAMSLAETYHYAALHFDHHRRQLTIGDASADPRS